MCPTVSGSVHGGHGGGLGQDPCGGAGIPRTRHAGSARRKGAALALLIPFGGEICTRGIQNTNHSEAKPVYSGQLMLAARNRVGKK